jgi:antitoxin component YwqK of YwqJK toxin-antitoxin module
MSSMVEAMGLGLFLYRPVAWCFLRGMKFLSILMVGVAMHVGGCGQKDPEVAVPKTVVDAWQLRDRDGLKYFKGKPFTGVSVSVHLDGQKLGESTYKDGKRDGPWTRWHENGQKWRESTYKDGKWDGLRTQWYENGQKEEESTYKDGKQDGLWTRYWKENGQKRLEGTYKDGKQDGLWTEWYENRQKWMESTYKDGMRIARKNWDKDGNPI